MPKRPLVGDFAPGFMMKLAHKDCRLALADGRERSASPRRSDARRSRASTKACSDGLADDDVGALLKLREEAAGVKVRLPRL